MKMQKSQIRMHEFLKYENGHLKDINGRLQGKISNSAVSTSPPENQVNEIPQLGGSWCQTLRCTSAVKYFEVCEGEPGEGFKSVEIVYKSNPDRYNPDCQYLPCNTGTKKYEVCPDV